MRRPEAAKEQKERRVAASDLAMVLLLHPAMSSQRLVRLRRVEEERDHLVLEFKMRCLGMMDTVKVVGCRFSLPYGETDATTYVSCPFTSIEIEKVDVFSCSRQNGSLRSKLSPWEYWTYVSAMWAVSTAE